MEPTSSSAACSRPSERLTHRLNMYAVAAGATGVGLLALVPPADGKIVYTPVDVVLAGRSNSTSYVIDLNHDGIADFVLSANFHLSVHESGGHSRISILPAARGNGAIGYPGRAAALPAGQPIDGRYKFAGRLMAWMFTYFGSEIGSGGEWKDTVNGYLGLAFKINGQIHYGWARLTVPSNYEPPLRVKLTGYAYETEVKKPIIAGQTSDADETSLIPTWNTSPQRRDLPATLGVLALGAPSLSVWRRREQTLGLSVD